jgi:hypothetical protein|tara:strand:+ start:136 stop:351 length:216 start_codon:yes stop_codon:yes gene_type:complete
MYTTNQMIRRGRIGARVDKVFDEWDVCLPNRYEFRTALIEMIVESEEEVLELQGRANMQKIERLLKPSGEV